MAVLLVLAVPALGLAHLGPEVLAVWNADPAGRGAPEPSAGLLTFDAPASTVMRFQAREKESLAGPNQAAVLREAALLKDWQYTALTPAQFDQLLGLVTYYETLQFNQYLGAVMDYEAVLNTFLSRIVPPSLLNEIMYFESLYNQSLLAFRPSPAPPASPTQ